MSQHHPLCAECETVSHCSRNGCIPKVAPTPHIIQQHSDTVRRVSANGQIIVQKLEDGAWKDMLRYDEMSDDYAYTNSRRDANRMAQG